MVDSYGNNGVCLVEYDITSFVDQDRILTSEERGMLGGTILKQCHTHV